MRPRGFSLFLLFLLHLLLVALPCAGAKPIPRRPVAPRQARSHALPAGASTSSADIAVAREGERGDTALTSFEAIFITSPADPRALAGALDATRPGFEVCCQLLTRLGLKDDVLAMGKVFAYLRSVRLRPDFKSLVALLDALATPDPHGAALMAAVHGIHSLDLYVDPKVYHRLLVAVATAGQCKEGLDLLAAMRTDGHDVPFEAYNRLLGACRENFTASMVLYDLMQGSDKLGNHIVAYNRFLDVCARTGHPVRAEKVFGDMVAAGVTPDVVSYTTLIHAHTKVDDVTSARRVFDAMRTAGVAPNVYTYTALIAAHRKSADWEAAVRLHQEMQLAGIAPSGASYAALLSVLRRAEQWALIVEASDNMTAAGVEAFPSVQSMVAEAVAQRSPPKSVSTAVVGTSRSPLPTNRSPSLMESFRVTGEWRGAVAAHRQLLTQGVVPNGDHYTALLSVLRATRQWDLIVEIMEEIARLKVPQDEFMCNVLIEAFNARGDLPRSQQVLRQMVLAGRTPNQYTYVTMMTGYRTAGNWRRVLQTHLTMIAAGFPPTVISYTIVISALARAAEWKLAVEAFGNLTAAGLEPDLVAHTALLDAYRAGRQGHRVFKAYHAMQNVTPDLTLYNVLIGACAVAGGRVEDAERVLDDMQMAGVVPNVTTFNSLITVYEKALQWEKALEVPRRMEQAGIQPDLITFNTLITACEKGVQYDRAMDLLRGLTAAGLEPNVTTYSALISVCDKTYRWEMALRLLADMRAAGLTPNVITWSAAISACARDGQWQPALQLFQDMLISGTEPNLYTYSSLISAFERNAQWERAVLAFQDLQAAGLTPNLVACNSLLAVLRAALQADLALRLIDQMPGYGVTPDVITYTELIRLWLGLGRYRQCEATFEEMRSRGIAPDTVAYNWRLSALVEANEKDRALEVFREMQEVPGLALDSFTYNLMIEMCERGGQWQEACVFLDTMRDKGLRPNPNSVSMLASLRENRAAQSPAPLPLARPKPSSLSTP